MPTPHRRPSLPPPPPTLTHLRALNRYGCQAYQVLSDEFKKRIYDLKDCPEDGRAAEYQDIHPKGYTSYYVAREWINKYAKDKVATLFDWYGEPYHVVLTMSMAKKYNFVGGPGPWKKPGKRGPHDEREADEEKGDHGTLEAVNETITHGGWEVLQAVILRKTIADHGGGSKSKKRCAIM